MEKTISWALVWAVLFNCRLAVSQSHAAVADADLSSPAMALAVFRTALEHGEAADLAAVSFGDAKLQDWVGAEAGQLKALNDLKAVLSTRFGANFTAGDKGKDAVDRIDQAMDDDLRTDLGHARLLESKGDEVILEIDESKPDDHQGRIVRTGGRWKVDLASLSEYVAPDDVPVMKAVAREALALVRDVSAGKFATIDDASDAIDERLTAAVDAALPKPATQESPQGTHPHGKAG